MRRQRTTRHTSDGRSQHHPPPRTRSKWKSTRGLTASGSKLVLYIVYMKKLAQSNFSAEACHIVTLQQWEATLGMDHYFPLWKFYPLIFEQPPLPPRHARTRSRSSYTTVHDKADVLTKYNTNYKYNHRAIPFGVIILSARFVSFVSHHTRPSHIYWSTAVQPTRPLR